MTTHTIPQTGRSQCDAILAKLEDCRGEWVPMPELVECSGSYNVHSRIADLRKRGIDIQHRNARRGKSVHSFYKYTSNKRQ